MFQQIFKSKENKNEEKIEGFFQKGKSLIQGKLYKQAMIQFNHALELDDGNQVYEKLIQLLDEFSGSNPEAALAVGLNLLTERPKDFLLANKLGNFARELHDYKQAEGLYKQAIKVNRSYDLSIYNLAASKARVPYYDDSAKSAVEKFSDVSHFVLPDYITDSDEYISEIKEKATNIKKEKIEEKCEELQNELEKKKLEGIEEEVEKIQAEIEELNKNKENILPRDIYEYFEELAQQETSNASIHFYNQGIYALSHENPNPKKAIEAFKKVDTKDKQFAYLKLAFALAKSLLGNVDEAINLMIKSLGENRFNRYYNANLGLLYRKKGNTLLSYKYLILTSFLLEKSAGLYSIRELRKIADEKFSNYEEKEALDLYIVISSEIEDISISMNIGEIYIRLENHLDAIKAFKKVLSIQENYEPAKQKLQEIFDYFISKAKELCSEMKMQPAIIYYQNALKISRPIHTLKELASVYKQLKDQENEERLLQEVSDIEEVEKATEKEKTRLEHIQKSSLALKKRNYPLAIQELELAFRMKLDKDVYFQLIKLYKGLKKTYELKDLEKRWESMLNYEEKMKKFERAENRKNAGIKQNSKEVRIS